MHSSQLQGEAAQLGNTKQRHIYVMSVAQLQQHSSGGDVGGPEEAPLVAPAITLSLRFFTVGYYTWDHTAAVELL